ncbi:hypothetical protein D9M72_354520 [compost metagenome]
MRRIQNEALSPFVPLVQSLQRAIECLYQRTHFAGNPMIGQAGAAAIDVDLLGLIDHIGEAGKGTPDDDRDGKGRDQHDDEHDRKQHQVCQQENREGRAPQPATARKHRIGSAFRGHRAHDRRERVGLDAVSHVAKGDPIQMFANVAVGVRHGAAADHVAAFVSRDEPEIRRLGPHGKQLRCLDQRQSTCGIRPDRAGCDRSCVGIEELSAKIGARQQCHEAGDDRHQQQHLKGEDLPDQALLQRVDG